MYKITNEFLADLLGKTATEMQEILKPVTEGVELTPDEVKAKIQPLFTDKFKIVSNEGFSKANAKIKEKTDKTITEFKQEIALKLGVDLTENLTEMLDAGVAKLSKADPAKITEADIVKHPLYTKIKTDTAAEIAAAKNDFEKYKGEISSKEKAQTIRKVSVPMLEKLGFAIPEGQIGENVLNALFSTLLKDGTKVDFDTLGNPILTDNEGNLIKDPVNLNAVTFETLIKNHASGYLLPKAAGAAGGGTGNGTQPPNPAANGKVQVGSYVFDVPKDSLEFRKKMTEIKNEDELKAYQDFGVQELSKIPQ